MPPPFSITLLLLAWCVGASHGAGVRLVMLAKGFGAPRTASAGATPLLPPTRPSEHRRVEGAFAKLLSQVSKVFEDLRPTEGVSKDVYVRVARTETCWFVGKVNYRSNCGLTGEDAATYYAPLIVEYSKALRPTELAGPGKGRDSTLEIWLAPGNTEMDVAKNTQALALLPLPPVEELPPLTAVSPDIGYEPEIYQNGEQGFRVKRDLLGAPIGKVLEVQMASPAELERLKEQQQGQA